MNVRILRIALLVFLAVCIASLAPHARAADPIVTTDLLHIRTVSAINVARDGEQAVVAVRSIERATRDDADHEASPTARDTYEYRSHLFLLDLTDPAVHPMQLTHGARNDRSPVIAPDGRSVAFVRDGAADHHGNGADTSQVWIMPLNGGEARQVTWLEHGARSPQWSPTGQALLVTTTVPQSALPGAPTWSSERPNAQWPVPDAEVTPRADGSREEVRAWLDDNAQQSDPVVVTGLDMQTETSLRTELRFDQLALVDLQGNEPATRMLTQTHQHHRDARFMPDGQRIVFASQVSDGPHIDRIERWNLFVAPVDDPGDHGEQEHETISPTLLLRLDDWSARLPKPSSDGSVVAFTASSLDEPGYRQRRLGLVTTSGPQRGETVWLTDKQTFDAHVNAFEWMHARGGIVFTSAMRGGFPLLAMSPGLLRPDVLHDQRDGMPIGVHDFGVGAATIVYAETSPMNPCVLRMRDPRGDRLLWDLNEWVASKQLSVPRARTLTRPDGVEIQYWVMEPTAMQNHAARSPAPDRPSQRTYPLVLQIHGGPSAMWGPGEATMWHEFQLLCSWGYGVVYANPRGSGGYGYEFQRGNHRNWGNGPAGDVLAVVDQCLLLDWVDPDRLVVTGGSYGGYLTAYIIGNDHRFKAAVAQRGVYDLATFFGEGNAWRLVRRSMDGWPFEPRARDIIRQNNPWTYVHRIRTPLLIMHGSNDLRTGVSQSEMLYRALKVQQRPVEYVRYPGADHNLSRTGDPAQRLDRLNRMIDFFERHIDNDQPAPGTGAGTASNAGADSEPAGSAVATAPDDPT